MTAKERKALEAEGFAPDQINEIEEGMRACLDTSIYARKEFLAIHMEQIRLGLMEGLDVSVYASVDYDWLQMEEIRKGMESGVDVKKYAFPYITYDVMRQIREGLEEGLDLSRYWQMEAGVLREFRNALHSKVNIAKYIKAGYDTDQLKEIRLALERHVDIDPYLLVEMRGVAIAEIREGLEKQLDVSSYARIEYTWQQMREIRLGLEHRVSTKIYTNAYYNWQQMREIRLGLEEGLDVGSYVSLMYTSAEMREKRHQLEQGTVKTVYRRTDEEPVRLKDVYEGLSVEISEDEMEAYLCMDRNDREVAEDKLIRLLHQSGVRRGILGEVIDDLVHHHRKKLGRRILIARGHNPKQGKDGWYEFFVKTEKEREPRMLEDGSVDYQNTEWIVLVKEGDKVAYYHEAEAGEDGYTVTNKTIMARKGKELGVLSGKGFYLSADQRTYTAAISGKIDIRNQSLEVSRILKLEEMTTVTGKVDFEGTVYVKGRVGSGAQIKASEDVVIDGFVEGAEIECGGSVILRQGMNASGRGSIRAGKEVVGNFVESAYVYCAGDIKFNYCFNSNLYAEGRVVISGSKGDLVGGMVCAVQGIKAHNVGNRVGIPTYLKMGTSERVIKEKQINHQEILGVEKELNILRNAYVDFRQKYPVEVRNTMEVYLKVENAIFTKEKQMEQLEKDRNRIDEVMKRMKDVEAIITGTLYEGVTVEIGGVKWLATNMKGVTCKRVKERIAIYSN